MKAMTKKEFIEFAKLRGCIVSYSGHLKKFFIIRKYAVNINELINSKAKTT